MAAACALALRHLIGLAAGEHEPHVRPFAMHDCRRRKQQIESLVGLECARVQHHRRRRVQPERLRGSPAAACDRRITRAGRVLDQHRARAGHDLPRRLLQMRTDHDRDARSPDRRPFEDLKHPAQQRRPAEREILELLRQARVHVVEMRNAERGGDDDADGRALLVRVHGVVAPLARAVATPSTVSVMSRNTLAGDGPIFT